MKSILFTSDGFALYSSEFNSLIPEAAIEISDELYAEICSNQDGKWELIGGEIVKTPLSDPTPPPPQYPRFSALEMLDLFTEAEQLAVVSATMSVPAVKLWYDRLIAATYV